MLKKLNDARNTLYDMFPDIPSGVIKSCIVPLECFVIKQILDEETVSPDRFEVIEAIAASCPNHVYDNLNELVTTEVHLTRELSHGASQLDKLLVSKEVMESIASKHELDLPVKIKMGKVLIQQCDLLCGNNVIGLCRSKFDNVNPKQLVIKGLIRE